MNINSGKSKKCPLCKKTVYLTNGRYACETCGYIINNQSGATLNTSNSTYTNGTAKGSYDSVSNKSSSKNTVKIIKGVIIGAFAVAFLVPMILIGVFNRVAFDQISGVLDNEEVISVDEDEYIFEIESFDYDNWPNFNVSSDDEQVLPYSELYRAFATEVFGKSYDTVTAEEYGSITYLHQYYYEDKIEYAINDGEIKVFVHDGTMYDYLDKDIRAFTGLKVLNLERESFYNDDSLEGLSQLTEVWTGNTPEELTTLIDNPEQIEVLGLCDSYYMTSLSGLENFPNVTRLYVMGSYLEDLTGLASLTNLTELTIENGNSISNFTDLAKLTYLEKLTISSNKLKNLSVLDNLTGLKEISLTNTYITDISVLSKYKDTLTKLELLNNYDLEDCSVVSQLTNLNSLSIEMGYYSQVPDFSKLSKLTSLYLDGAQDITNLGKATNLTELTLESCNMDNMSVLSELTKVKYFKLKSPNSFMEVFEGIPSMTSLETLDMSSVWFYANIEKVFSLPNLNTLIINDSRVCIDLEKMPENKSLQVLDMNGATLEKMVIIENEYYDYTDYEEISLKENMDMFLKFPNLQELYVADLEIESVEVLSNLKCLRILDISNNSVSALKPLSEIEDLERVWCGGNTIIDSDSLSENVEVIFEENY